MRTGRALSLSLTAAAVLLLSGCSSEPRPQAIYFFEGSLNTSDEGFSRALSSVTGEPVVAGNRCRILENGTAMFSAMLEAIRRAEHSINVETYIFQSDATGVRFARALEERARAGVHCRVLVDAWGSHNLSKELESEMKKAGVEFARFRPIVLFSKFTNRTHRKILVVDGMVGFVGGQGFDNRWDGDADSPGHWHDVAVQIEGPAVARLQSVFSENWIDQKRTIPAGHADYPELSKQGDDDVLVLKSSFGERGSRTALSLDLFLHAAKSEILIENAYFLPNDTTIDLLKKAVERGVKVEVIVPGRKNNLPFVRRASRALYGRLLLAGVKIYEYRPTMMHAKTMVVDGEWSSIGSSNIDNRSFFLNDEANVNVRSRAIAAELEAMFERDKGKSAEITYEKWKSRSLYQKIVEKFFGLFQDQF